MIQYAAKNCWWWLLITFPLASFLGFAMSGEREQVVMPGDSTHGHHQIELACVVCHTKGDGVKQNACTQCHAEELNKVGDSHPVVKFKDPRNADRLEQIEATLCISCHREHQPEITRSMAVTVPDDFCYYCHQDIGLERPTHVGLPFDSCATSGCHNFHDNSGLFERFLAEHLFEPDFKDNPVQRERDFYRTQYKDLKEPLTLQDADMPSDVEHSNSILHDWASTAHAAAGVNCTDCHEQPDTATSQKLWIDKPDYQSCQSCHTNETKGWLEGKHGMRMAADLSPMTPGMARIPMQAEAAHRQLSCVSCHGSHEFDPVFAAVDACLQCHSDEHSVAFKDSKHFLTFSRADRDIGQALEAVSCATCHMPRVEEDKFGETFTVVEHNQNNTLRPNDKMIRPVCTQCHGLQFTLNSLADVDLIRRNFQGLPTTHVESLEMVLEEQERAAAKKEN